MVLLSKKETATLLNGIFTSRYNAKNPPYWLFSFFAANFYEALKKGFVNKKEPVNETLTLKDIALERALRENVFYFAASKTQQQLIDFNKLLTNNDGTMRTKAQFLKVAGPTFENYNIHWFRTEYNTTQRLAKAGREWVGFESQKEVFPYLRFIAVMDANTRPDHAAANGIIRPVDDPIWGELQPPLDWNCRCRIEQVSKGKVTDLSKINLPKADPAFAHNVAKSRKIWKTHPYFDLSKANRIVAKQLVIKEMAAFKQRIKKSKKND